MDADPCTVLGGVLARCECKSGGATIVISCIFVGYANHDLSGDFYNLGDVVLWIYKVRIAVLDEIVLLESNVFLIERLMACVKIFNIKYAFTAEPHWELGC
jgi:hypothetical protein